MKRENLYVSIDSRNRITIPKSLAKNLSSLYKIYRKKEQIVLEPIQEIPKEELWLFDPKNKHILDELKKALKQKAHRTIDLSEFED